MYRFAKTQKRGARKGKGTRDPVAVGDELPQPIQDAGGPQPVADAAMLVLEDAVQADGPDGFDGFDDGQLDQFEALGMVALGLGDVDPEDVADLGNDEVDAAGVKATVAISV